MINLLSAQFSRLFKSKLFYVMMILFALGSIGMVIMILSAYGPLAEIFKETSQQSDIDIDSLSNMYEIQMSVDVMCYFDFYAFIISSGVFISLFIGREFDNNTIRNKVIIGTSRPLIYLSNLIVCSAAQIIIHIVHCVIIIIPLTFAYLSYKKIPYLKVTMFDNNARDFFIIQIIGIGIIVLSCSIHLLFTMVAGSRTRGVIASMLAVGFMIVLSQRAEGTIYNPEPHEYIYAYSGDETSDTPTFEEYDPYNGYENHTAYWESSRGRNVSKTSMTFYGTIDNTFPTSQASYLMNSDSLPPRSAKYILSDLILSAVLNAVGIIIFNRKELN
ncbi:MAG: ABC transporter permease subunit [Clostridia bacterium]|nr:ABC transporter permease subunit [Clostridia bacterium]